MVVMENLELSVYLLLYPDGSLEWFWTNIEIKVRHRIFVFFNLSKRHLLLHSLGWVYRRQMFSVWYCFLLQTDSWKEFYFSTYEMKYRLVQFPFSVHCMFLRFKVCRKCVAGNHIAELKTYCYITFVNESHSCDLLVPDLFMYATAVWNVSQHFYMNFC